MNQYSQRPHNEITVHLRLIDEESEEPDGFLHRIELKLTHPAPACNSTSTNRPHCHDYQCAPTHIFSINDKTHKMGDLLFTSAVMLRGDTPTVKTRSIARQWL